jgi:hypothetical protein
MDKNTRIYSIGGSRNIGYFASLRLLRARIPCSALSIF